MAQGKARAFLRQKSNEAYNNLTDQWEDLQKENVDAQNRAGWGRLLGGGLGLLAAMALPGALPLWGAMLASGAGSRLGSEIGEHVQGKWWDGGLEWGPGVRGAEGIGSVGMREDVKQKFGSDAETLYGGFDEEQDMDAILDMVSTYVGGGGYLPGGKGSFVSNLGTEMTMPTFYDMLLKKGKEAFGVDTEKDLLAD